MTVELSKTSSFTLGGLLVEPALRAVQADGARVSLEPRVMQVLVLLASRAGEPVDRDTMVEQCWDGVIVGDDAIQRCIGRLRRLAAEVGGYEIETIPKVGYRLLEEGAPTGSTPPRSQDRIASPPRLQFEQAMFRGDAAKGSDFSELLCADVAAALSINRDIVVLTGTTDQPADFRAGIEVRQSGDTLRINCSLTETATGRLAWSTSIDGGEPRALESGLPADSLVLDIAGRIGAVVIEEVTRASLSEPRAQSAWQAVVRANAAYQRINLENLSVAVEEARSALTMEPDFAAAHAALANALAASYELGGAADQSIAEEARLACDMALALAPEDPTVLAWTAHALLMITRPAEGLPLAEKAVDLAPAHWIANLYLARHYLHHSRPEDAERALDDHARVAPLFPWKYFPMLQRGLARFMQGDTDAAEHLMRDAALLNPRYPYSWMSLMILGALKQDEPLMKSAAQQLKQLDGAEALELQLARIAHSYPDPDQAAMVQNAFRTAWET
ncbi:winged helix-turn-helix domain-containing protein [Erythrobacter rubeus]|uniref:Winged helix-turn-helix domain-containing protein n=1 Tax=Erythrobacter rubeus TaxID=2760803 RepID=A0ABR8KN87_9SPHN|nr:winged helix-turn-helix domain-containing protein [Erythrobacter rubeus]MBD2842108.1 winged helix-turn-helix domain-containing protein [Erythrobacter rubeus]